MTYEKFLAALALWREARNQSLAAKTAVYHVIVNRATDSKRRWPSSMPEVVLQPWQFSSFNANDPNVSKFPVPSNKPDWKAWLDCEAVVSSPLAADPTQGANHYHDNSIPPPAVAWLGKNATPAQLAAKLTCEIGSFKFYKL
jgi:hypothetical protein